MRRRGDELRRRRSSPHRLIATIAGDRLDINAVKIHPTSTPDSTPMPELLYHNDTAGDFLIFTQKGDIYASRYGALAGSLFAGLHSCVGARPRQTACAARLLN